jgi:hypothetical protein
LEDKAKAGSLTEWEEEAFEPFQSRQKKLKSRRPRDKLGVFLLGKTGMVERSKQRTTSLRPEEERHRMETRWRFWDWALQLISTGNSKELAAFVAQPERFCLNRHETVISMSDQIPVWLKPDSGKRLMPKSILQAAQQARRGRKSRKQLVRTVLAGTHSLCTSM